MPVYLFTFHTYRSWSPAHPRGYVRHHEYQIRPTDPQRAQQYDDLATQPAVYLKPAQQRWLIAAAKEACIRRAYRLHAIAVTASHIHLLISWRQPVGWNPVDDTLKRILGYQLTRQSGTNGHRWFSRGYSRKHIRDRDHFDRLLRCYLPNHRRQHGLVWCETHTS